LRDDLGTINDMTTDNTPLTDAMAADSSAAALRPALPRLSRTNLRKLSWGSYWIW